MGPEGPTRKLRHHVADVPIILWERDLLEQVATQINIPAIPGIANEDITSDMIDASGEGIDTVD